MKYPIIIEEGVTDWVYRGWDEEVRVHWKIMKSMFGLQGSPTVGDVKAFLANIPDDWLFDFADLQLYDDHATVKCSLTEVRHCPPK